jgi:1-acyl-sn-glycerol-3-phosphate acyltransferase
MTLFLFNAVIVLAAGALLRLLCLLLQRDPEPLLARASTVWARSLCSILGITVVTDGPEGLTVAPGSLVAANHQSYLDIIIIASVIPVLFVAKQEVRHWPVLGWLAAMGGTVFIDRIAFRGALHAMASLDRSLANGVNVQIFPEGTSTDGGTVLPFRSFLFHSAVTAARPVIPVTINYREIDGTPVTTANRDIVCWYGSMTFVHHLWELFSHRSLSVTLSFHPPIVASPGMNAKSLSESAYRRVVSGFNEIR